MVASGSGLRRLTRALYLPTGLYFLGQGAFLPVVALHARELGASVPQAGLVLALIGIGRVCGDVPAGAIATAWGERRAMLTAVGVTCLALVADIVAPSLPVYAACNLLLGMAIAVWSLARQSFIAESVDPQLRGRAFSVLGGVQRFGVAGGPFVAVPVIAAMGTRGALAVYLLGAILATVVLAGARGDVSPSSSRSTQRVSTVRLVRDHWRVLSTLGASCLLISAARILRLVAVPLWAQGIGLSTVETSVVIGLSGAAELATFYPGGLVMDRWGRAHVALPAMTAMGASYLLLPLTQAMAALTLVALLAGVGNGLSSGVVMTLGVDVSPRVGRARFLALWRLLADCGEGGGPVVLGVLTSAVSFTSAVQSAGVLTCIGGMAVAWSCRHVGRGEAEP